MKKIKLAVIFGGESSEYLVSLHSTGSFLHSIHASKYDIVCIGITREGKWYTYSGDIASIEDDTWWQHESCEEVTLSSSKAYKGFLKLKKDGSYEFIEVDCIFPVLHGKNGEDGTIQGLFELIGIPYVGCGHMSSSICMDKEMTHIVCENANIVCSPYLCVYQQPKMDYDTLFEHAKQELGLPIFIKPANAGSSFGISKIQTLEEFIKGLEDAFLHDGKGKVILEKTIEGFEIGCAIMGNQTLSVGSVDEVETSAAFFDYQGKYEMLNSCIHCPARISKELIKEAQEIAQKVYRALNCKGLARIDMFVTPNEEIILNEVNTIPGFTSTSRYPSMMKEVGISFADLIDALIAFALES